MSEAMGVSITEQRTPVSLRSSPYEYGTARNVLAAGYPSQVNTSGVKRRVALLGLATVLVVLLTLHKSPVLSSFLATSLRGALVRQGNSKPVTHMADPLVVNHLRGTTPPTVRSLPSRATSAAASKTSLSSASAERPEEGQVSPTDRVVDSNVDQSQDSSLFGSLLGVGSVVLAVAGIMYSAWDRFRPTGPTAKPKTDTTKWAMSGIDGPVVSNIWEGVEWVSLEGELMNSEALAGEQVMPCFPLGAMSYIPTDKQMLNIFEPRYCAMYNDIIFNGSRRFLVTFTPPTGPHVNCLAQVGVVFYISDLQSTDDVESGRRTYQCTHDIIGRKKITRILNPRADPTEDYLKVVVEDVEDIKEEPCDQSEDFVSDSFRQLYELQTSLRETPRFQVQDPESTIIGLGKKENDSLWKTAIIYQRFLVERAAYTMQIRDQMTVKMLVDMLRQQGKIVDIPMPSQSELMGIDWNAVPPEIKEMRDMYTEQSDADIEVLTAEFQKLIQCESHCARTQIMSGIMEKECRRLQAKQAIKSLGDLL